MNKAELITTCAGYLHRSDMNAQIDSSVAIATSRIGRDLRDKTNFVQETWSPGTTNSLLPEYLTDLTNVLNSDGSPLIAVTTEQIGILFGQGGVSQPTYYSVLGRLLQIVTAGGDDEFLITFFRRPSDLSAGIDTNDVLTAWPQLYVYAVLMESFFWTQDGDLTQYATQSYENEIKRINAAWSAAAVGSSPAMRRI